MWQGRGIWVILVIGVPVLLAIGMAPLLNTDRAEVARMTLIGVAAPASWVIGKLLHHDWNMRQASDSSNPDTASPVHSLFGIHFQHWWVVAIGLGVAIEMTFPSATPPRA